jgi:hypothetical protein
MRFEGIGMLNGQPFDLVVEATSTYKAHNNLDNGFECGQPSAGCTTGRFGQINVAGNTSVDLKVSFQQSATETPITLNRFLFSLHDIDQNAGGSMKEVIYITGFDGEVVLASATNVALSTESDGRTKLQATADECAGDNPTNPMDLKVVDCSSKSVDQKKRSAAFVFANTDSFTMTLEATCDGGSASCTSSGRSFLFTGDTNLVSCD